MKPTRTFEEVTDKWINAADLKYGEARARVYAKKSHEDTNHKYGGGYDYVRHLAHARDVAERFINLVPLEDRVDVLCGVWVHDVIEDARQNYNDVRKELGTAVAEYSYALTNNKGKNRKERANAAYYAGIRGLKNGIFIKLCDRIANVEFNLFYSDGSMLEKYREEYMGFYDQLIMNPDDAEQYAPMFDYLKALLYGENDEK